MAFCKTHPSNRAKKKKTKTKSKKNKKDKKKKENVLKLDIIIIEGKSQTSGHDQTL